MTSTDYPVRRFAVTVDDRTVQAFHRVVSRPAAGEAEPAVRVPLTYPAVWYGREDIRKALAASVGLTPDGGDAALIHLEQSIEATEPLEAGGSYDLEIETSAPIQDGKLKVRAVALNEAGAQVAVITSLFAIMRPDGQPS